MINSKRGLHMRKIIASVFLTVLSISLVGCILSGCGTGTAAQKQKKEANQNKEQSVYKKDPQQNSYERLGQEHAEQIAELMQRAHDLWEEMKKYVC